MDQNEDQLFEKPLPANLDAERLLLGSILLNDTVYDQVAEGLDLEEWALDNHKRIFSRMKDLRERGDHIDRITLVNELQRQGQLEGVGGLSVIVSLDEGLPEITNISSYIAIVKEKANLRKLIFRARLIQDQAYREEQTSEEIAGAAIIGLEDVKTLQKDDSGKTAERIITEFPGGINSFLDPTKRKRGLSTGFNKLDDYLGGGFRDGEVIVLGARPAVGKSTFGLNIAQHVCLHPSSPQRSDFFSLEMSGESLITRMLVGVANVSHSKFRAGYVAKHERDQLQRALLAITESPLRIHDEFKRSLSGLASRIRAAVKGGSKLIIIDYIQLLTTGSKSENRNQELNEIMRMLKLLAHDLGIPILVLSQIGRSAEKRGGDMRPQLSDFKDSGSIEETADTVLALHRPELYAKDREELRGAADLDILKQRNGELARIPLRFLGQFVRFENCEEQLHEAPHSYQEPVRQPIQEEMEDF